MEYKTIHIEYMKHVAILTINRPEALNALNPELVSELIDAITEMEAKEALRVVIVTGSGEKAFVAGADIKYMSDLSVREAYLFSKQGQKLGGLIEESEKVYLAAVNGFALGGGCEMALACDFIYASNNAKFGQPEVTLGVSPGFGGSQRLARVIGLAKAKELIYTGKIIDAKEALNMGIVNSCFSQEDLMSECIKTAKRMASQAPLAIAYSKKLINNGFSMSMEQGLEFESQTFASLFGSKDQKLGMKAFIEKQKPEYIGE